MATDAASQDRSRDEAALGAETLKQFANLDVLLVGLRGLGVEIAKNVILSGPRSVTLFDPTPTTVADTGVNYYLTPSAVGTPRASACLESLQELNSLVKVRVLAGPALSEADVKAHRVCIFTNTPRAELLRWNEFCRANRVVFLASDVRGVAGFAFADFGKDHVITDRDGQQPRSAVVTFVGREAGSVLVNTDDARRHGFSEGDYVSFREVEGMTQLNSAKPMKITAKTAYTFRMEGDTSAFDDYAGGGIVTQTKVPETVSFLSLADAIIDPPKDAASFGGMLNPDLGKLGRSEQLHLAFQALDTFTQRRGALPGLRNAEDAAAVVAIAHEFNDELRSRSSGVAQDKVDDAVIAGVAKLARVEFTPLNAIFGGIVAQEVMKATGKFTPLNQWLYVDVNEVLPADNAELSAEDTAPTGSRYDDAIGIFGRKFQTALANKRTFLVGAGALGCELLKAFALAGVGTGDGGHVTVTDMDRIELSNLSRQFLYRRKHVGAPKSVTSASVVAEMNREMHIRALEVPVGPTTEEVFSDDFWSGLDFVVNALDNVEARKYVDRACIRHAKPLLESGTLGTQANTQVIMPFHTEAYGDSEDPPEESIPMCTVREFPYFIEHCIEWARTLFAEEFCDGIREARAFIDSPQEFLDTETRECRTKPAPEKLQRVLIVCSLARTPTLAALVQRMRVLFEENFVIKQRAQLQVPVDFVDPTTGMKFWSGHKRPPVPAAFDLNDDLHRAFLVDGVAILAAAFGVPLPDGWDAPAALAPLLEGVVLPVFTPKPVTVKQVNGTSVIVEVDDAAGDASASASASAASAAATPSSGSAALKDEAKALEALAALTALVSELGADGVRALRVSPVTFEKDDDSNHHVALLTAATNMRARNYTIGVASGAQVRQIAGRIIPAIATTTCMITGFVAVEMYKVIAGAAPDRLRNAFTNTAVNNYSITEPAPPVRTRSREKHPLADGARARAIPDGFTHWHRLDVRGAADMTPLQLIAWLPTAGAEYAGVVVQKVFAAGAKVESYNAGWRSAKVREEKGNKPLRVLYESVLKTTIPAHAHFIAFKLAAVDADGVTVFVPDVYLHLR